MKILERSELSLNNGIVFNVTKITHISYEIEKEMERRENSPVIAPLLIYLKTFSYYISIFSFFIFSLVMSMHIFKNIFK